MNSHNDALQEALDALAKAFGNDWTPEQGEAMDRVVEAVRSTKQESSALGNAQCATFPYPNDVDHWRARALKAEAELAVLKAQSETPRGDTAKTCRHGWRGTAIDVQIQTPCPACGAKSLFIGEGGHLTCARVPNDHSDGCHSPSVEETVNKLKADLAAHGGTAKVPEGMVLVPVEPTPHMVKAAVKHTDGPDWAKRVSTLATIYRAMLAAAPSPDGKEEKR